MDMFTKFWTLVDELKPAEVKYFTQSLITNIKKIAEREESPIDPVLDKVMEQTHAFVRAAVTAARRRDDKNFTPALVVAGRMYTDSYFAWVEEGETRL